MRKDGQTRVNLNAPPPQSGGTKITVFKYQSYMTHYTKFIMCMQSYIYD
jgi:hypothetical protein